MLNIYLTKKVLTMNYRRMMLVVLVLLAVLTLGAVNASEDADVLAADSVYEVSVDASLDDEIISEGGEDSLASSDNDSALGEIEDHFDFDYQTHEAISKEEDDDWILDYNSDLISFRELVTLSDRFDSGRLEITDSNGNVLFNRSVAEMEPNYDMKGYKYDQFNGYVVFKEDLNNTDTGVYDITITYYDDEDEIVESVNTTVYLDYTSYVNDEEIDVTDYDTTLVNVYVFDVMDDGYFEFDSIKSAINVLSMNFYRKETSDDYQANTIQFITSEDLDLESLFFVFDKDSEKSKKSSTAQSNPQNLPLI